MDTPKDRIHNGVIMEVPLKNKKWEKGKVTDRVHCVQVGLVCGKITERVMLSREDEEYPDSNRQGYSLCIHRDVSLDLGEDLSNF